MTTETVKITYSADEKHYYITDHSDVVNRPQSWVPVGDGDALPFVFWKVQSGRVSEVGRHDPLVSAYAARDRWVLPGQPKWRELVGRILDNTSMLLRDAESSVAYYRERRDNLAKAIVGDGDWRRDDIGQIAALIAKPEGERVSDD